ncbi:hypothetical protein MIDIC_70080 [Alphaproteobacteria bacterium]
MKSLCWSGDFHASLFCCFTGCNHKQHAASNTDVEITSFVFLLWENPKEENGDVSPKKNGNKPTKANHEQLMRITTEKSEFDTERNRCDGRSNCN